MDPSKKARPRGEGNPWQGVGAVSACADLIEELFLHCLGHWALRFCQYPTATEMELKQGVLTKG